MSARTVNLRSGAELHAECLEPPLPDDVAAPLAALVNAELEEPYVAHMLRGAVRGPLRMRAMRGVVGGELAGTAWMGARRGLPELAVIGGVATAPAFRRQGVATRLVTDLCRVFDSEGGRLLWLATASDIARRIYERLGFRTVAGELMCRAAPGSSPDDGFRVGPATRARPADWGVIAALVPLYARPHPCVFVDAGLPHLSTRLAGTRHCVGFFWRTWRDTVERGGRWLVLENSRGWLVASAVARPAAARGRIEVDFIWHPAYGREGRELLARLVERIRAEDGAGAALWIAEEDSWKRSAALEMGFSLSDERREATVAGRRLRLALWERDRA